MLMRNSCYSVKSRDRLTQIPLSLETTNISQIPRKCSITQIDFEIGSRSLGLACAVYTKDRL